MFDPQSQEVPTIGDVLDFGDHQQTVVEDRFLPTTSQHLYLVEDKSKTVKYMIRRQFRNDPSIYWSE